MRRAGRRIFALYREAYRGLPREIWRLAVVAFINRSGTMVVPFLTLWLTGPKGFSTAQAGLFLTLFGVGGLVGTYLGGWASDRIAPRRLQIGSLALTGLLFFLLGIAKRPVGIAVSVVAVALVGEAFRPANSVSLARWSPPEVRSRSFGLRRLAVNLGMTFGPAVGGFLALRSYGFLFAVDGATCLLAAAALARLLPDEPKLETGAAGKAGSGNSTSSESVPPDLSPWRDAPFLVFMALLATITLVVFQLFSTLPLTLRDHYGMAENDIGMLLAVNTLLIIAFEMVLIHGVQRFDPLRMVALGALLLGGGFALLPLGSSFAFAALTVAVWTFGEMLTFPLGESVVSTRAGRGNVGSYLGLFATSFGLSFAVAQMLGPWIYQTWGFRTLWYGAGGLGALVAIGLLLLAPRMRQRAAGS